LSLFSLKGKVAAITGAGSGIGYAIAKLFAQQGAQVAVLEINDGAMKDILADIKKDGGTAEGFVCDVGAQPLVEKALGAVVARFGKLDILVNNAGIAHVGNVENTTETDFDRLYRVNVKGVFFCTQTGVKQMLEQGGGVILNMDSIAGLIGLEDRFAYSMTKGAVLSMTRSTAVDYVKKNIRCNCICPARVHTPFVDGFLKKNYPGKEAEKFKELSEYQPIGRMAEPLEVAHLALYLVSDEASFITGQAYPIDGGVLME